MSAHLNIRMAFSLIEASHLFVQPAYRAPRGPRKLKDAA
jgi:hypothetical protein